MQQSNGYDLRMHKKPKVSIVINCYNGEKYLREATDSVLAQTYTNWEVVFWDNASTDKSKLIVQHIDQRIKYYCSTKTVSLGKARNLALKQATGDLITFLDHDDRMLPNMVERLAQEMEDNTVGLVYGSVFVINAAGNRIKTRDTRYEKGMIFYKQLKRYEIPMACVMIRKSILENEKLGFPEDFVFGPDYNLFMKISLRYPVAVVREILAEYRHHAESLSFSTRAEAAAEVESTIKEIETTIPCKNKCELKMFKSANKKIKYYSTISHLTKKNRLAALKTISSIALNDWKYVLVFCLICLPLPNKYILKILGR